MTSWAKKRQTYYGIGVLIFIASIITPIVLHLLEEHPTCFDGIQNQGETAVDKGGPCKVLDERRLQQLSVLWARSFQVRDGLYNALAYVENPNIHSGVDLITYQFKLYDEQGVLLAERFGKVPILPGKVIPILETGINLGNRRAVRTFFQFVDTPVWRRMADPTSDLKVIDINLVDKDTTPRVEAKLQNTSVGARSQIVLVATVFDTLGNAFASSRTFVNDIDPNAEVPIVFTWPEPFVPETSRIDVKVLVLPE